MVMILNKLQILNKLAILLLKKLLDQLTRSFFFKLSKWFLKALPVLEGFN